MNYPGSGCSKAALFNPGLIQNSKGISLVACLYSARALGLLSSYPFFIRKCTHVKVLTLLRSLYLTNKITKAC